MSKFEKVPKLNAAFVSSQKAVELLEKTSAADLSSAVPFIKILRVKNGRPDDVNPLLNTFFQKPPEFGSSIASHMRYGDRPPISLDKIEIAQELSYGLLTKTSVTINLVVHRADAFLAFNRGKFELTDENRWVSLITPGVSHLIEYGWRGAGANPLFNGEGFIDEQGSDINSQDTRKLFIDSTKTILFTTSTYNFSITNNGEIKLDIKGYLNGDYLIRDVMLAENKEVKKDAKQATAAKGEVPIRHFFTNIEYDKLKEELTKLIKGFKSVEIPHGKQSKTEKITLYDVLNVLRIGESITELASKHWNYKDVKLYIGDFNNKCPVTSEKLGTRELAGKSIGDFVFEKSDLYNLLGNMIRGGVTITISSFLDRFLAIINNPSSWQTKGKNPLKIDQPTVKIKIAERRVSATEKEMLLLIFDVMNEEKRFGLDDRFYNFEDNSLTRARIKELMNERNVPVLSLGKGNSFIKDANFEIIMDNGIFTSQVEKTSKQLNTRQDFISFSEAANQQNRLDSFHTIWQSGIQGTLTTIGNFCFDMFGILWIDFGVSLWDGPFRITKKTDIIEAGNFTTNLEIISTGEDPLNTKIKKTKFQFEKQQMLADLTKQRSDALAKAKSERAKQNIRENFDAKIKETQERNE